MTTQSSTRSLLVLLAVALLCSILVSVSAVVLRPIQQQNELIERYRNIVSLTGLLPTDGDLSDADVLAAVNQLDVRVLDLNTGSFEDVDPESVSASASAADPNATTIIPSEADLARLGSRANLKVVYLVWNDGNLSRYILPIYGQGMWSTLRGFIAIDADLNTIAALTFYEQGETAGLGDQIEDPAWQARWAGKRLFAANGDVRFQIASGPVDDSARGSEFLVDALSGATVTTDAVTSLIRFWFGPYGYGPFLATMASEPPARAGTVSEEG